jgi:hypothetical protein
VRIQKDYVGIGTMTKPTSMNDILNYFSHTSRVVVHIYYNHNLSQSSSKSSAANSSMMDGSSAPKNVL